jgi:3-keto-disaccharide hydrolase
MATPLRFEQPSVHSIPNRTHSKPPMADKPLIEFLDKLSLLDAFTLLKILVGPIAHFVTLAMHHSSPFHYCSRFDRCKYICLTVITPFLLLFVGCRSGSSTDRGQTSTPQSQPKHAAASTNETVRPVPSATPAGQQAVGQTATPGSPKGEWQSLFDGKTLKGWAITDFAGHGEVKVEDGAIILGQGFMTGITRTNPLMAEMNYEIALDAMRVDGSDFFCGLTFPVAKDPCSFIVGGWGGGVVGLSSLDSEDAANNETTKIRAFDQGKWYAIRVRVEPARIQAWIDEEKHVDVVTTDRKISIRIEVEPSRPLGIASWSTTAALKNIRMRKL